VRIAPPTPCRAQRSNRYASVLGRRSDLISRVRVASPARIDVDAGFTAHQPEQTEQANQAEKAEAWIAIIVIALLGSVGGRRGLRE
jgi:hypothetical protein